MTSIPVFNFKSPISEADVQKLEKVGKEPKGFQPGKYDLKILEVSVKGPMAGDNSWVGYTITLGGIDSRSIRMYLGVPTASPIYNKPGLKNEHKLIMFHKFREFMKGLGESPEVPNIPKLLNKYFKDTLELVGKSLTVNIGYAGPHVEFVEKGDMRIRDKQGKPLLGDQAFSDRDSAKLAAIEQGILLKDFPEVLKIDAGKAEESEDGDTW